MEFKFRDKKVDEDWKEKFAEEQKRYKRDATGGDDSEKENELGDDDIDPRESEFLQFVARLASEALVALGQIPHPMTGQRNLNLNVAQYTIDSINMLKEKTSGNLTPSESEHFINMVSELQNAYTQVVARMAPPPPAPEAG